MYHVYIVYCVLCWERLELLKAKEKQRPGRAWSRRFFRGFVFALAVAAGASSELFLQCIIFWIEQLVVCIWNRYWQQSSTSPCLWPFWWGFHWEVQFQWSLNFASKHVVFICAGCVWPTLTRGLHWTLVWPVGLLRLAMPARRGPILLWVRLLWVRKSKGVMFLISWDLQPFHFAVTLGSKTMIQVWFKECSSGSASICGIVWRFMWRLSLRRLMRLLTKWRTTLDCWQCFVKVQSVLWSDWAGAFGHTHGLDAHWYAGALRLYSIVDSIIVTFLFPGLSTWRCLCHILLRLVWYVYIYMYYILQYSCYSYY